MNQLHAKPRATVPLATTERGCEGETMATATSCQNCGLPVAVLQSTEVSATIWYHPTLEREVNIDGAEVMVAVTFCPNDLGEAEPREAAMDDMDLKYLTDSTSRDLRDHLNRARNSGDETAALLIADELLRRSVDSDDTQVSA